MENGKVWEVRTNDPTIKFALPSNSPPQLCYPWSSSMSLLFSLENKILSTIHLKILRFVCSKPVNTLF